MIRNDNLSATRIKQMDKMDSMPLTSGKASGDCCNSMIYSCRICGEHTNLRYFYDTHVWDGVEKRYDQLLYEVFGIRPNRADGMICECCIRQLRNMQRFRSTVTSAFAKTPREMLYHTKIGKSEGIIKKNKNKRKAPNVELIKRTNVTIDDKNKKRWSTFPKSNVQLKRIYVPCTSCQQKYSMIASIEGWKNFVCSRCKKNNTNNRPWFDVPRKKTTLGDIQERVNMRANVNLRCKTRLCIVPKNPSQPLRRQCSTDDSKNYIDDHSKRLSSVYLTKSIRSKDCNAFRVS